MFSAIKIKKSQSTFTKKKMEDDKENSHCILKNIVFKGFFLNIFYFLVYF